MWSAEVGVLLPFVEERRQWFLDRYGYHLQIPFESNFGTITDVRDLEINHIDWQLKALRMYVEPRIRRLVAHLCEIRNALSHLEPVSVALLVDGEL